MAMTALRELQMTDPSKRQSLIIFVEIDRCISDAIQAATGRSLGRRNLKLVNYGKFAATFVDTSNGRAVRIASRKDARDLAMRFAEREGWIAPGEQIMEFSEREKDIIVRAYSEMPEAQLMTIEQVRVRLPKEEMPGRPTHIVACTACGELVFDHKETVKEGRVLCRSCAFGAYYEG